MPVSANTLRLLVDAGISGDALVGIVGSIDRDMASDREPRDVAAEKRRAWDRERKAAKRASGGNPVEIPVDVSGGNSTGNSGGRLAHAEEITSPLEELSGQKEKNPQKPSVSSPRGERGTRLPADWKPSPEDLAFAHSEGLSEAEIEREMARFRDFWSGKSGANAIKRDWPATWRNWIRKVAEMRPPARAGPEKRLSTEELYRAVTGGRSG